MRDNLDALLDRLETAHNERALRTALSAFAERIECSHFAYLHLRGEIVEVFTDYPREWRERYFTNRYAAIDPVVADAKRTLRIRRWTSHDPEFRRGSPQWAFLRDAEAHGLCSGLTIPIRVAFGGTAMLAFATNRPHLEIRGMDMGRALTATAFLHMKLAEFGGADLSGFKQDLTPRETLCLTWASLGRSMKDTAALLGITERTVRFYLDEAKEKLGARDIKHAIRIAVENGLI